MAQIATVIHEQVSLARGGELSRVITKLKSGWLVAAEKQVVSGYCLLLPDPVVSHLNDFPHAAARDQSLHDMAVSGEAILGVTGALRINYEILGNLDPALHAHIIPRSRREPAHLVTKPIWFFDWDNAREWSQEEDGEWMYEVRDALEHFTVYH